MKSRSFARDKLCVPRGNHQGLDNRLIERSDDNATAAGRVLRRRRLGGMLNFYYRVAA
jgi:hypothetical protein